jgi:transcriptional regulator with XRE-family HTH domain
MTLKDLRLKAGLKQIEVAKALKLGSVQYISNAERGICGVAPRHWKKLSKLYKVEARVFYDIHMAREEEKLKGYL